ncbi:MAG: hypothetical protein ABIR34_01560, partial [Marmoricola sp.]
MFSRFLRLFVTAMAAIMILGLSTTAAEARGLSRVSSVSKAGQHWDHAKLKVKWKSVKGAKRYGMRISSVRSR